MSSYDIYGIGAALVDTEIDVSNADLEAFGIEKGVMTLVDESRQNALIELLQDHLTHCKRASGGSAANSIIGASYFGSSTCYSCKVANDENGAFYLDDLSKANVAFHTENGKSSGITGKCLVMITPDAERTMNTFLGISETLSSSDIDQGALKQSRYAYIEGYLVTSETGRAAAISVREIAQQNDVKVAISLSDPALAEYFRDGLREIIGTEANGSKVDLLFCNREEALAFTETSDLEQACKKLEDISERFVVTLGAEGALVFDGHSYASVDGVETKAVDSNGAGDMFAGAFLHAINAGADYAEAAQFANRAAAQVVSQYGPRLSPEGYKALLPIT